jgi:hypothetical protein
MADATTFPNHGYYVLQDSDGKPITLARSVSGKTTQTFEFSAPLKDGTGSLITGMFKMSVITPAPEQKIERIFVKTMNATSTATATVNRGIAPSGIDVDGSGYPTQTSDYALEDIPAGSICAIAWDSFDAESTKKVLRGNIATGANSFQIGDGTATEQLIKANQGLANDSAYGFDASGDPIIYKADGSSFVPGAGAGSISGGDGIDVTASVISADLDTDSGLEINSEKLRAKVKTDGGLTRDSDGLSVNTDDFVADLVDDTAFDESTWNGVTDVAPSKNAVRDKFESLVILTDTDIYEVVASTNALLSATTQPTTTSTSYVKMYEFTISFAGDYKVRSRFTNNSTGGAMRVYKDGSPIGVEHTIENVDYDEDFTFAVGEAVQLYMKATAGTSTLFVFSLMGDIQLKTSTITVGSKTYP